MYSLNLYFIITIIVCRFWGFVLGGNAVLHNNGYKSITVAIGKDVPEDHKIIDNIMQMFEDASSVLYEAKGVYFSGVTIVVPSTWSNDNGYDLLPSRWPLNADIRVDLPHPVHGDLPYTLQPRGCGAPGIYTHLSPTYAANMFHLQETYGPPGKVLVQQWAHLRWGVFDEYGGHGTSFPSFYVDRDFKLHATGCTYDIVGWMRTKDGEQCQADTEGLPDEECQFFSAQDNTISASLMNFNINSLRSVNKFCDKETHNPAAPTAHNLHCNGKSVGEVIAQHEDFKGIT